MRRMTINHVDPQRKAKPRRNGTADRDVPLAMKAELVGDDPGDPAAYAARASVCGQRSIAGTPEGGEPMQTMPLPTWSDDLWS